MIKFFAFLVIFFLLVGVGSVCVGQLVNDTSIISLSGKDWSLKVDGVLQSSLDSRNVPYMTSKSVSEKELFLELESFEDCKLGVVQFKVGMQGLTAYKQLPLDLELDVKEYSFVNSTHAIDGSQVVVYRPENIVNSFALFDDLGRKQAHISASKLVASDGAIVWCDSNLEGGLLTVILPLDWLEGAKFPVVLDPTFGYTTVGGTSGTFRNNLIRYFQYNATEDGNLTAFMVYTGLYGYNIKAALYSMGTDAPDAKLVESEINGTEAGDWVYLFVTPYEFSAGSYWFAVMSDDNAATGYLDSGGRAGYHGSVTYPTFPATASVLIDDNYLWSVYAIYTVGEPEVTPTPTPSPSPSPSPVPSSTTLTDDGKSNAMLFVLGFMVVLCVVGLVWLSRVPVVVLLVGLFTVLVGLYCVLGGVYGLGVGQGWFALFTVVFGGLTMLLVGLGVRVRK